MQRQYKMVFLLYCSLITCIKKAMCNLFFHILYLQNTSKFTERRGNDKHFSTCDLVEIVNNTFTKYFTPSVKRCYR